MKKFTLLSLVATVFLVALGCSKVSEDTVALKMDKSTWTDQEKLVGQSLSQLRSQISTSTLPYTAPTPKACPNIGDDGLINGKESMAYYVSWGIYGRAHFPKDIDGCNITGVLYAFGYPAPDGRLYVGDPHSGVISAIGASPAPESSKYADDPSLGYYGLFNQIVQFKKEYPHIKTYFSVGGWTWSTYFSAMASKKKTRKLFIADAVEMLQTFQFDGIDIDWEFPKNATDRKNFTALMKELRVALDDAAKNPKAGFAFFSIETKKAVTYRPHNNRFTLSLATPNNVEQLQYLDISKIDPLIDFVLFMAYDYAGAWAKQTGHQAALYDSGSMLSPYFNISTGIDGYLNGDKATVNPEGFNEVGFNASKVILGFPYYGRGWATNSDEIYQIADPGTPARGTWGEGVIDTKVLHDLLKTKRNEWIVTWDDTAKAPMAYGIYKDGQTGIWTYDDVRSICEKTKYANNNNLRGVFAWETSGDDGSLLGAQIKALKDANISCETLNPNESYDKIFVQKK